MLMDVILIGVDNCNDNYNDNCNDKFNDIRCW